jgi:1,4-dihydroxy-2-naphthoate octaprenyltransferase
VVLVLVVLSDVLAFVYSAPPIRLRDRRYWDWLFVFLWKGIIVFAGYYYFYGLTWPRDLFVVGSLVVLLVPSLISQIDNQLRDFRVDHATKTPNTVQRAGARAAAVLNRLLAALFYAFSLVFCAWFGLYRTMLLVLINIALYRFVKPGKARHVVELANVWIVILFLERSAAAFAFPLRVIASVWIVAMAGFTLLHVKRARVFA